VGAFGLTLLPKAQVDVHARLQGLGRIIDALAVAQGPSAAPTLIAATDKRGEAVKAFAEGDYGRATAALDEAAAVLMGTAGERGADLEALWRLEKLLGIAQARTEALNWTKPMLSMNEQLTLVLVLELAFGVIFELPLVMAVLGMVGLVSSAFLIKYQRHAFVVCLIIAAIITPTGDAVNLALMAGPMLLCFELGVLLVWIVEKRRATQPPSENQR
jgi:sec-independent protein translocase protein TatC